MKHGAPRHAGPSVRSFIDGLGRGSGGSPRHAVVSPAVSKALVLARPFAVLTVGAMVTCAAASGVHDDSGVSGVHGSSDALPLTVAAASRSSEREDLFAEGMSTTNDGAWSLGDDEESLGDELAKQADEQTRKLDEEKKARDAESKRKADAEAKRKAEEQAKKEAETRAAGEKQSQQTAANASSDNDAKTDNGAGTTMKVTGASESKYGGKIAEGALSLVGGHMDCTMLATLALQAGTGIYFHGWPEDYRNFPGAREVAWGEAQPGDILVYRDGSGYDMNGPGHADHVAIYIGNGKAVHGGWMGNNVAVASAVTSSGAPEHVYRVM